MAEPARSDHDIVVQLFPAPIDATPAQIKTHTQYAGKFAQACKLAREDERRKREPEIEAVRKAVQAALTEAHGKELIAMGLHADDNARHRAASAFWRGSVIAGATMLLVAIGGVYGAYRFGVETQMSTVAAMRAVNAPRGLQLPPPDASQQPEWARP